MVKKTTLNLDADDKRINEGPEGIDLRDAVDGDADSYGFGTALFNLFAPFRGIELDIPPRTDMVPDKSIFDE